MLPYLLEAIKNDIVTRGSGFVDGLKRIEKIVKSDWLERKDKITLLKKEYGTGGASVTLCIYDSGFQDHNPSGVEYRMDEEDPVKFTWSEVLALYERRFIV